MATTSTLELRDRFRTDMGFYAPKVLKIQTKQAQMIPLRLNRAQRLVDEKVEAQLEERGYIRALVLKARQEGISTYVAGRVYRGCSLHKNRNALVLGDTDERSTVLHRIYDRYQEQAPEQIKPATLASRRGREMLFVHDSQISVLTAGGRQPGRAMTRWYLHLSEMAFWEHQIDTLTAVLQTVPSGMGEVFIESTANGVGDEFHNRWLAAEAGESDWLAIFLPWWIHEEYTLDLREDARSALLATLDDFERSALDTGIDWEGELHTLAPEQLAWRRWKIANDFGGDSRIFRQEFPSTAEEAFLVSGNAFFDEEALAQYRREQSKPLRRGNLVELKTKAVALRPAERGYLRIWSMPLLGEHYVIAADTASGKLIAAHDTSLSDPEAERGGRDFSSGDVLRCGWTDDQGVIHPPKQVAQLHGRMAPEVFAQQLARLGWFYACAAEGRQMREPALIAVENNHESGQTVIRWLREHAYHKLFVHRRLGRRNEKLSEVVGWVTDATTRMPMLDELAEAVRNSWIDIPCPDTIRELFTFVRGDDGRPEAQEGTHDDRVVSLAIDLQMTRHHNHGAIGTAPVTERADSPTGV